MNSLSGKTLKRAYRRADRQRQVGAGAGLAEKTGGIVVNADSMQVYRDLRVITARPTLDEEARVPHRLYGHVDAAVIVRRAIGDGRGDPLAEARGQNRLAIFVGGSGLYFKALTRGLSAVPPVPAEIRERVRARLERDGVEALHAELAAARSGFRRAPETARSHPRCARA